MKRKQVKAILTGLGVTNRFSLKTVTFLGRGSRQVLTVKDWKLSPKAELVVEAFYPEIIVDFERSK